MNLKRQLQDEEEADHLAERQSLVAELERLTAAHQKEIAPLMKAETDALASIKKAEDALQSARVAYGGAMIIHITCSNAYSRARDSLERALLSTAPKEIDEVIGQMRILHDEVAQPDPNFRLSDRCASVEERQAYDERLQDRMTARDGRLARIRLVIDQAKSLKLEAFSGTDLKDKLDALRRAAG